MTVAVGRDRLIWWDRCLAFLLALELILEASLEVGISHRMATVLVAIPFAGTVAVRRRWPAWALVGCGVLILTGQLFRGQLFELASSVTLIPFLVCAYGVGAWLPWRSGLAAATAGGLLLIAAQVVESYMTSTSGGFVTALIVCAVVVAMPWVLGRFLAERRARAAAFDALAEQAAAEHERLAVEAIQAERALIGRELQDIIAHSVMS